MPTRPHVRWNFWVNFVEGVFGVVAWQLFTHGTVLPGFIGSLLAGDAVLRAYESRIVVVLGVILPHLAAIPGILATGHYEGLTNRKTVILSLGAIGRLQLLGIAVATFLLTANSAHAMLWVLAGGLLIMRLSEGLAQPLWLDVINRLIPPSLRGRLFGGRDFVACYLSLGLMLLFPLVSRWARFPADYGILFLTVFVLQAMSWLVFAHYRELPYRQHPHAGPARVRLLAALRVLIHDPIYRRLMVGIAIIASAQIAPIPLITTRALVTFDLQGPERVHFVSYGQALSMLGYSFGILLFGFVGDRWGYRPVLYSALAFLATGFALVVLAASPLWCLAALLLAGLFSGATVLFWLNYPLEFTPPDRVPTYVAVRQITTIPPAFLSLLGGWIADRVGFQHVFTLGIGVLGAAAVYFYLCVPPSPREAQLLKSGT